MFARNTTPATPPPVRLADLATATSAPPQANQYATRPAATLAGSAVGDPIFGKLAAFGDRALARVPQAPAIPRPVVVVLTAATTLAEEIEDVIQKTGGIDFKSVLQNPVAFLGIFGDVRDGLGAVREIATDGRAAVEAFLAFDDEQRREAFQLVRRELDLSNDVAEAHIEMAVAVGLTLAFTIAQFTTVVLPQVQAFINARRAAR